MYGFYGAYNCYSLVFQISGFITVSEVSRILVVHSTAGYQAGGKPCRKTRETAALRRSIQKTLST